METRLWRLSELVSGSGRNSEDGPMEWLGTGSAKGSLYGGDPAEFRVACC